MRYRKSLNKLSTAAFVCASLVYPMNLTLADSGSGRGGGDDSRPDDHRDDDPSPTPSASPTSTPSPTPSFTPTPSPSPQPSATPSSGEFSVRIGNDRLLAPSAKAEHKIKVKRGVIKEDRAEGKVKLTFPHPTLNAVGALDPEDTIVELLFYRAGEVHSSCTLELGRISVRGGLAKAEYKFDISSKQKRGEIITSAKKGLCDSNLSLPGIENTPPDFRTSDVMSLEINGIEILRGVVSGR